MKTVVPNPMDTVVISAGSLPRESIPGYVLLKELHRGAQGVVYLALQQGTQRKVAVKVLIQGPFAGPSDRARFEREIRVLAHLQHPNIVQIHESGEANGFLYLVMDYVRGRPLDEHAAAECATAEEVVALMIPVCEAVQAAHSVSVVHRDLKPKNVLVTNEGEPFVLDFGLAKGAIDAIGPQAMTTTGEFIGSVPWASPEQAEGRSSQIDSRSDVYSLGVILYQALTGRFPYDIHGQLAEITARIVNAEPGPLCPSRVKVDFELETIVRTCLAKEKERRYANAGALAADLRRYLAGEALAARRDSSLYRLSKQISRRIALHSSAAQVIAVALAVICAFVLNVSEIGIRFPNRLFEGQMRGSQLIDAVWHDDVVVIAFDDATFLGIDSLAQESAAVGVSSKNVKSWRSLHGKLMNRLAIASPQVVVWDYLFPDSHPQPDSAFVEGVRAIQAGGGKVVCGIAQVHDDRRPVVSPTIGEAVDGLGWIDLMTMGEGGRECVTGVVLVVSYPPEPPQPSLSLQAYSLAWNSGDPRISWNTASSFFEIAYATPKDGTLTEPLPVFPRRIRISEVQEAWQEGVAAGVDVSQRRAAGMWVKTPTAQVIASNTVTYREVFGMNDGDLADRFGGKIVVVADQRLDTVLLQNRDRRPTQTAEGVREEFSGVVHAAAISSLLTRPNPSRAGAAQELLAFIASVALGWMVGHRLGSGTSLGVFLMLVALAALAILAICAIMASLTHTLLRPGSALAALVISSLLVRWIRGTQLRHSVRSGLSLAKRNG